MLSIICSALAYSITYYILGRRAFLYVRILARFCQVVNDGFLSDRFPGMLVFTPKKERMDSCLRRNDGICRNDGIYRMSWFDWIPVFAGMTCLSPGSTGLFAPRLRQAGKKRQE